LGLHAHWLKRYGVDPQEDVSTAVEKLNAKAPHLAALLREIALVALQQEEAQFLSRPLSLAQPRRLGVPVAPLRSSEHVVAAEEFL